MFYFLTLQERRLGVQHSSIYAILAVMMASLVFHATIASVVEFCLSRVAVSNSKSLGYKFDETRLYDC